jgi:uncharacterized protein (TIGR02001 family)
MRTFTRGILAGAALFAMVARVGAEEPADTAEAAAQPAEEAAPEKKDWLPGDLSGNVGLFSDYSFRGVSQTQRNMALQAGLDWTHDSGVFLGLWGSNVDFDEANLEQDFYGGWGSSIGDFSYSLLGTFFFYPGDEQFNYWEFAVNTAYDFKVAKVAAGFLGSPDYFGTLGTGVYASGGVNVPIPLPESWTEYFDLNFDTKIGYTHTEEQIFGDRNSYLDWSAAFMVGLPFNLLLDLRYVGTDVSASDIGSDDADDRVVVGMKYSF